MRTLLPISILSLVLLCACSTHRTATIHPHAVNHTADSMIVIMDKTDSVYVHDSVFVLQKNDTIVKERWHTKFRYKYIYRDSIHTVIEVDSIPYPVEITKIEKVQYTPKIVKALAGFGAICLFIIILFISSRLYQAFK